MASGEHFVEVFFQDPGLAHPPAWHLVNHRIGPQVLLHFGFDIIAVIDYGDLYIVLGIAQETFGYVAQGLVQLTVGVAELLLGVNNQDITHGCWVPVRM
ncbi:hypothetical protein D3C78_1689960 [compost metagenome]